MRPHPFTVSRRAILAGGTVSALAVLAACSSNSASQETSPAASGGASTGSGSAKSLPKSTVVPTELDSGLGSGQADGVFPRTVVHYQGESTINAAPTNIVVIGTGQADALLTLGSCPIGAAMPSGAEDPIAQYLKDAHPDQAGAIATITSVGSRTSPDTEAIGNLRPDLIATNASGKDDADTLYQSLTQIAPTVSMHGTGQYWRADFLLLADALGKREEAQRMLDAFTAEAAQRGAVLDRTATVSLLRSGQDKLRIFGPLSFVGSVVADLGLARPKAQQFTDGVSQELSSETLDKADGDWLFYGVQSGDAAGLTGEKLWPFLSAVSAGRAVEVDHDPFFLNAGPTAARVVMDTLTSALSA